MKVVLLGAPRPLHLNRWKDCIAEAGTLLGWDFTHLPARGIPAGDVVRHCKDGADLLIWARTHGHDPTGDIPAMLRSVEDAGVATVGIHLDLYWGIPQREAQIGVNAWWSCRRIYTADGGHQAEFAARGVDHAWMPPPLGPRWLGRTAPDPGRYPHQVVFVGGNVTHIHSPHRARLIGWARRRYGPQFRMYGRGHPIWGADLSALYATAHTVLGDSAPSPRYWSDRIPCSLGRGGLLAHPRTEGMAEQGFTDEVMVTYERGEFGDLGARIDALTTAQRRAMTDAAVTLISERHLWTHRLERVAAEVLG